MIINLDFFKYTGHGPKKCRSKYCSKALSLRTNIAHVARKKINNSFLYRESPVLSAVIEFHMNR